MRNRIVTAVKQRFSIRKLSIGAASVLLGTSLYFMGPSAPVVHAATTGAPAATTGAPVVHAATEKEKTGTNDPVVVAEDSTKNDADPVVVAGDSTKNDADVNNAIDKYAQGKQEKLQGDHAPLIRPSDTQSVTVDTPGERAYQVGKIKDKIDSDIEQANKDNESIEKYKNDHQQTLNGEDSDFFKNQGLSVGDEKDSKINQISVDHKINQISVDHKDFTLKDITLLKDQSKKIGGIDGIDVTYTNKMTKKEQKDMKIDSDNKVIIDLQHDQCSDKEITVTYDDLKNSYYLENINNKTNKIKISKIERTFSHIQEADKIRFTSDGKTPKGADGVYDKCDGPQLIIYNDPSDGFFYNNITKVSVKDIYYDDNDNEITFDTKNDKNKAWIFVTSLNSNGVGNSSHNVEKVRAQGLNNSPVNAEKIKGSTVTVTNHIKGWWYSDENNWFNKNPDWDNNAEDNRFGFVGTVAFQYQPGMTLQYWADDSQWGSHWACTQTQVVSSLDQRVIIYDHIKDGTENVTGNDDVNMTVHYVMDDGSKAPSDSKQTVNFTETGVKDKVTGKIAWTPADSQTLNDVPSPVLTGYTADIKTAKGKAVNFGDPDINVTVHYSANAQTAKITYIDDTTKKNLYSQAANGKFGQTITFETAPTDDIASYKKQGYVLVSNSFNNQTYAADNRNNVFYVHLKHKTEDVTRNDTVTRTIHYLYDNGNTAQPDKTQTVSFNETGTKDDVTGETTWSNDNAQSVDSVNTPSIVGYTPDKSSIEKQSFKFGDQDVEVTVTYHANAQIAKITYIDDTTKKNLDSQAAIGKFGQAITFETAPTDEIDSYKKQGYVLVSNNFDNQTYQAVDSNNVFEVHFKHGTTSIDPKHPGAGYSATDLEKTVTRTINYLDGEGNSVAQAHDDSFKFTASGTVDKVTGKLVSVDDRGNITGAGQLTWNAENYKFDHVDSPTVRGMHVTNVTPADQKDGDNVKEVTVTKDSSDIVVNVYYAPNGTHQKNAKTVPSTQTVKIVDNQGKELRPSIVDSFTFSRTPDVTDAEGKTTEGQWNATEHTYGTVAAPVIPGYVAEKGRAGGKKATIDNPNVVDQIVYHKLSTIIPVTPDHKPIPNAPQPEYPNDPQDPTNVKPGEPIPNVPGYTPVDPSPITPQDPTKPTEVIYTKTGTISVKYHDTTEDKDLKGYGTNAEGKENDPFTYDPTSDLKDLEGRGYVVDGEVPKIPNKFNDGPQTVVINVKHGTTTVTSNNPGKPGEPVDPKNPEGPKYPKGTELDQVKRTGTQTIHYVGAGDKTPADNKQTFVFTRKITFDDVTGKIISVTPWSVQSHTFGNVDTPVIPGYHADKAVAGGATVTPDDLNKVIIVTYAPDVKDVTTVVHYIDEDDGNRVIFSSENLTGKEGTQIGYKSANDLKNLTDKGYVVDKNGYDPEGQIPKFDSKVPVYEIKLKHGKVTVTPKNPGKPGKPINSNDPDGPKWPAGTDANSLTKTGTQTIHYVGAGDKTPADNTQTYTFIKSMVIDKVTGKVLDPGSWNIDSHTFGTVKTPVITGYHADKAVAGGETVTPDDLDKVITVTYAPDGNPGNPSDHGDTPSPEPTPEPEPTPNPTPDDQPDSETSSDEHVENVKVKGEHVENVKVKGEHVEHVKAKGEHVENVKPKGEHVEHVKAKGKLDKTNPKKVAAYKKERKIIKTKIAKQGHTEIAEPKLPQTGEADNSIIGLLGMLLASFAAMFGFDSLHSHDKKHKN